MSQDPRVLVLVLDWIGETMRRWGITFAEVEEVTRRGAADTRAAAASISTEAAQAQEYAQDLGHRAELAASRVALAVSAGRDAIGATQAAEIGRASCRERVFALV